MEKIHSAIHWAISRAALLSAVSWSLVEEHIEDINSLTIKLSTSKPEELTDFVENLNASVAHVTQIGTCAFVKLNELEPGVIKITVSEDEIPGNATKPLDGLDFWRT